VAGLPNHIIKVTKSRENIYGAATGPRLGTPLKRAKPLIGSHARPGNKRMLGFQGPAQPSPALGDALNAGYLYLEVKCLAATRIKTVRP